MDSTKNLCGAVSGAILWDLKLPTSNQCSWVECACAYLKKPHGNLEVFHKKFRHCFLKREKVPRCPHIGRLSIFDGIMQSNDICIKQHVHGNIHA
ncbi:hypothetical protein B9Z55_024615 [Caenorhabditis nigoni]|uniref:Uncharacterized protein n=1 Tax=Caenorhabditis nigoni TaxID=1611254 RepID=A0A2G5SV86_9PELO|nr:hypothetical protein B9Z55_024615 [Caenorhabditis nigoni]